MIGLFVMLQTFLGHQVEIFNGRFRAKKSTCLFICCVIKMWHSLVYDIADAKKYMWLQK